MTLGVLKHKINGIKFWAKPTKQTRENKNRQKQQQKKKNPKNNHLGESCFAHIVATDSCRHFLNNYGVAESSENFEMPS